MAGHDEIVRALDMVGAIDFVRRLRDGLEHVVLEGGLGLSGGQQQALLLATARAYVPIHVRYHTQHRDIQVMKQPYPAARIHQKKSRSFRNPDWLL